MTVVEDIHFATKIVAVGVVDVVVVAAANVVVVAAANVVVAAVMDGFDMKKDSPPKRTRQDSAVLNILSNNFRDSIVVYINEMMSIQYYNSDLKKKLE
jgi:hypothetical protein